MTPLGFRVNTPLSGHSQHPSTRQGRAPHQHLQGSVFSGTDCSSESQYRESGEEPTPGEWSVTGESGRGGDPRAGQTLTTGSPPSAIPQHHPPARVPLRGRAAPTAAFYGAAAATPAARRRCACACRTAWQRPAGLHACAVS